jgi:hypothetical protein
MMFGGNFNHADRFVVPLAAHQSLVGVRNSELTGGAETRTCIGAGEAFYERSI